MTRLTGIGICAAFCVCFLMCGSVLAGLPCPHCQDEFHSRGQLKEHIASAHPKKAGTGRTGIVCKYCGKYFQSTTHGTHHQRECPARTSGKSPATKKPPTTPRPTGAAGKKQPPRRSTTSGGVSMGRPVARPGEVLVTLQNGAEFAGRLTDKTDAGITIKTPEGAEMSFKREQIKTLVDHTGKPLGDAKKKPKEEPKKKSPGIWNWLTGGKKE